MKQKIEEALAEIQDQWMKVEGVEGVGKGKTNGEDCIIVFISMETPEIKKTIPSSFKGYKVKTVKSGGITAQGLG
jgi:hypothetical protein